MSELIDRQSVLDALEEGFKDVTKGVDKLSPTYGLTKAVTGIYKCLIGKLPSAQPTFDARDTQYNLPIGTDCISRQAAIDALGELATFTADWSYNTWMYTDDVYNAIKQLPPIQPAEPKRGRWIKTARWGRVYYCNQCRNYLDFDGVNAGRGSTNFCPNCGAKMEVDDE